MENNKNKKEEEGKESQPKENINKINIIENEIIDENKIDRNKKYKIKFSSIISELRENSDKMEKMSINEFTNYLLLMSSQINQTNKISCLTLLSYINYKRYNALITYYLNKKIFKYLQIQKNIESFIYVRTLFRAAFFLEKEKNFFYAKKYVVEAENLSKNSNKITPASIKMLKEIKINIEQGILNYFDDYKKKFRDVEKSDNLTDDKYTRMKKLFKEINNNEYKLCETNENVTNEDSYFYIVNKNWFIKAYQFFNDYIKIRDNNIINNYFKEAFDHDYSYYNYFDIYEEIQKKNYKYSPFPGLIDNYSIINWTDNWLDPLNEDENLILQKNLQVMKDYYLLEKKDFDLLKNFFGVTNIIKRKKINLIELKVLILDKRLAKEENNFILRKRNLQINKDSKIIDLKNKILRCINYSLDDDAKEKKENKGENKENNKKENKKENKEYNKEENKEDNKEDSKDEIQDNNYKIYFYLLSKEKKDILMEICVSLINNLPKYESIYLENITLSENDSISNLLSRYNKKQHILIIELQQKNFNFISQILPVNNTYICSLCKKEINSLENSYKCNICNYSLFCSEDCAENDEIHKKLDTIYLEKYLYEEFNLESFFKKDISKLPMLSPESSKGMVGLKNLGNTCYINSTLQCLSNTVDLTKYFLLQYFRNDINTGNKLGSSGSIAEKYYNLICQMWCGLENKITPNTFINAFKNLKTQFEGYRQQDAQEFLSVLLDQLHEDLNRITDKPYIELLEKQQNEDDLTASKRWWDLHRKREDSIIIDLFNGQFKSETICQICGKSSITYDPFLSLCVPLPKLRIHVIFKIFIGLECKFFDIEYDEKCTLLELKQKVIEYVKPYIQDFKFFDLEMVLLDENKNIQQILSVNIKDKNSNKELKDILTTKNELIFYEKKSNLDEINYINFFIYPIEHQKPDRNYVYYHHQEPLKFLSYPLFFQIKNDTTVKQFYTQVLERIRTNHAFIENKFQEYLKSHDNDKILGLNLIHGKDTKKGGFFSMFYIEDTCKFCNESNESNYYCSIMEQNSYNKKIKDYFQKMKKPVILAATSDCYNLSGEGKFYLECPLFDSKNNEKDINIYAGTTTLKDCLELFIANENIQMDDSWYCNVCKKLQKSKQKLQIYKPPYYLIILIKRYNLKHKYGNTFSGEKNNTFISYPIENFDITEYIVGPEKNKAKYDLYGVIEHFGTLNHGHYTAICKNAGNWVNYNDSTINFVKSPVTKNAYVLFYKMKNIGETNSLINGK